MPWTKPEDLTFDPKGPLPPLGIRGRDKGRFPWRGGEGAGAVVLSLCDFGTHTISWPGVSESTLRRAIIRNDGEPLGWDW